MIYRNIRDFSLKSFVNECNQLSECIQINIYESENYLIIYTKFLDKKIKIELSNSIKNKIRVVSNYLHKYNFMQKLYINFDSENFDFNNFLDILFAELLEKYMHIYLCDIEKIQNLNEFESDINDLNLSFINLDLDFVEVIKKFNYLYINNRILENIDYKKIRELKIQICKCKNVKIDYIQNCLYINEIYEIDAYILENLIENAIEYLDYDIYIYYKNELLFIDDISDIFFNLFDINNIIENKEINKNYDIDRLQLLNLDLQKNVN